MTTSPTSLDSRPRFFDKELLIRTLVATFVLGLLAHAYCFFNTMYGHDGLNCLVNPVNEVEYKLSLGRFSQYFNYLFRGFVSAPWQLGALSLFWLAMGNYCLLRIFQLRSLPNLVVLCGLTVTSIAVTVCNATCLHEIDNYALAFFMAAFGVYSALNHRYSWLIAPCVIAFATGLYQAYFSVSCSLAVIYIMVQILKGQNVKQNLLLSAKLLSILVAGILLYTLIHKGILTFGGVSERDAYNGVGNATDFSGYVPIIIPLLQGTYKYVAMHFAEPITDHSRLLLVLNCVVFAVGGLLGLCLCWMKRIHWLNILLLGGLALSLPFALNLSFFLSKGMIHELMIFSFVFVYVFLLLIVQMYKDELASNGASAHARSWAERAQILTWAAMAGLIFYHSNNANHIYLQAHLMYQNSLSVMTRMLSQLENTEGYDSGLTPVVLVGSMAKSDLEIRRRGFEHTDDIYGIAKNTNMTYPLIYKAILEHVLFTPVNFCAEAVLHEYELREDVLAMPQFPHRGWCQMIDGKMVIKLSDPVEPTN